MTDQRDVQPFVVTAEQMRQIEERLFAAGMPVAALMEKVAGRVVDRIMALYPWRDGIKVGVLVGSGHNGGDALVVARELHFKGYKVCLYQPFERLKELTGFHAAYCRSLGIPTVELNGLRERDLLVDGLFGFGLERSLEGEVATAIAQINEWAKPVVSIDLPSGLHTDTGETLGTAIRATQTLCLGLWKQGLLQDGALEWAGNVELIDFDLPIADIRAVLGSEPKVQRVTAGVAIAQLPLTRSPSVHKYKMGHVLLICGSHRYGGATVLCGLGARASGVGMLSIAVPESIKPILSHHLPEALVIGCPETETGAIAELPDGIDLEKYTAIACGPGLTPDAELVIQSALKSTLPLVLDADGLNVLSKLGTIETLQRRTSTTVLTPHLGEFKRLFPKLNPQSCRVTLVQQAAAETGAIVLLKGARVAIADAQTVWINPESTPALARGGSGDVLTGLTGGLIAQALPHSPLQTVAAAVWWHSQAGVLASQERTQLGVDPQTLGQYLIPTLHQLSRN